MRGRRVPLVPAPRRVRAVVVFRNKYVCMYVCMCVCIYIYIFIYIYIYVIHMRLNAPLKADHPERPTISLGWSREPARGILDNYVLLLDFAVGRSGWHRNRGVFVCAQGPQDSSKGGAVETGCSGLHYIIGCFTI